MERIITAKILIPKISATVHRTTVNIGGEVYDGIYDVVPATREQVLETAKKTMKQDVIVRAIPYYEVNNTDGTTVIIG